MGGVQCHRGACGHGVQAHYLHRWLTCESTSRVFALAMATFATSSDVRVKRALMLWSAVEDVGRAWIGRPPRANTPVAGMVTSPRRRLRWRILWIRRAGALRSQGGAVSSWSVWTISWAHYVHRWLTCESTSRVFASGDGDIRDQLRRACQEGTSDVVGGGGRRWSRLDWAAA